MTQITEAKTMATSTDRIEKRIDLKAPRARVWKAISDSAQFGAWFQMSFDGAFVAGKSVTGRITSPGKYEGFAFSIDVETVEPETYFAYRWHPYAVERGVDYSKEPTTLVEIRLEEIASGTRLHLVESGFDRIPAGRRVEAFRMNDAGWTEQVRRIERWVDAGQRIVRRVDLAAPRSRVWKAISDTKEHGTWFGVVFEGPFVVGQPTRMRNLKDDRVVELVTVAIEPESYLAYRWHPFNKESGRDYSKEEPTLVEYRLAETPAGTQLVLTESGFDRLPPDRASAAHEAHEGGWTFFVGELGKHVAR